ncbi:YdeI/OmpD-associated family protein [Arthrobacter sp. zg-Y916]|uniref:YdeI/OmpD-associated family protein n=1 Tax=Arthrobacter caoxuetaonis TaxID=2886935 RepID=A0A9X1ME74_9MICC|nr:MULTISPECIES: YdeI/OmpD-associated family protein [Arthrobacter]MCC3298373.1 YdeI/OmpD-associated family protein [Arthrobacter caoxuetaonis]MCC9195133.1 YdeI/OmpD-associated family protein [Arthrobacter sp. zg-Y916]USQ57611.1 YdeI/OmpD-associated family protein [Arthrobacter caoxuetaonis]
MKTELPELLLPDAAAWREWLEEHHLLSAGVWLVIGKRGGNVTALTYQSALDEALCFGWIDGQAARRDAESYRQRYTRRGPKSMWSLRNVGHIGRLEAAGRMHPAGRDAVESAKADGRWDAAYAGPASMEIPADLLEAIAQDAQAQAMFDVLSSQNRFALGYRLGMLKTREARERNIARFVQMLGRRETFYPQKQFPD